MAEQPVTQADTRAALVTGGGTGIGRAAALALAAAGYSVTVAGRTAATLVETVKLVSEAGGKAKYVIADVHDEDAIRHSVEVAARSCGWRPASPAMSPASRCRSTAATSRADPHQHEPPRIQGDHIT